MFKCGKATDCYGNSGYVLQIWRLQVALYWYDNEYSFHIHWERRVLIMGDKYPSWAQLYVKRGLR